MFKNKEIMKAFTYPIIASGKCSIPELGEGRLIPGVVIDVSDNKSIVDLIEFHNNAPSGDAQFVWAFPNSFFKRSVILHIEFSNPMQITFAIEFDIAKNFEVVDAIIHARGLYLAHGTIGDSFSGRIEHAILMEIPNLSFDAQWEKLLDKALTKRYSYLSKAEKKITIDKHKKSMRELWKVRRR